VRLFLLSILLCSLTLTDGSINSVTKDTYDKTVLKLLGYREAAGEGCLGIRAVMHVVDNRVQAGWGSWLHVITAHNQFSSMSVLGDGQTIVWPIWEDPTFLECDDLAEKVYTHTDTDDPTNGALYYYNPKTATSQWFIDNIVNKKQKVAVIGHHEFFR